MLLEGEGTKLPGKDAWLECWVLANTSAQGDPHPVQPLPTGWVHTADVATTSVGSSLLANADQAAGGGSMVIKVSPIKEGKDKYKWDALLGYAGMRKLGLGIDKDTGRILRAQYREHVLGAMSS